MMDRYIHWSFKPVGAIHSVSQVGVNTVKPDGLWFSVEDGSGDGWSEYCRSADIRKGGFRHAIEITLDLTNILTLHTLDEMRQFYSLYRRESPLYTAIDWLRVSYDYDGLMIPRYMREANWEEDLNWYYSWDVASGCVWNHHAVTSVQIAPPEFDLSNDLTLV